MLVNIFVCVNVILTIAVLLSYGDFGVMASTRMKLMRFLIANIVLCLSTYVVGGLFLKVIDTNWSKK